MTAQIFVAVVCLLALKYTLELAARTGSRRRKAARPATLTDRVRRAGRALPRRWAWIISAGVIAVSVGWVSDRAAAPAILLAGVALLQAGAFLGGIRWARRPRRSTTVSKASRNAARPETREATGVRQPLAPAHS